MTFHTIGVFAMKSMVLSDDATTVNEILLVLFGLFARIKSDRNLAGMYSYTL